MKIDSVQYNNHKSEFLVTFGKRVLPFPYAKLRLIPTAEDPIVECFVDEDLGCEAFTYYLKSGKDDSLHLDAVLDVNRDPEFFSNLIIHKLTVETLEAIKQSGLGKRQLARQMGTSPAQLYRLLDPTNYNKSLGQLLFLLHLANKQVTFQISDHVEQKERELVVSI